MPRLEKSARVLWLASARTSLRRLPEWSRPAIETALENIAALVTLSEPARVMKELGSDASGLFSLVIGEVTLSCHVDLFGTNAITVKRLDVAPPALPVP